MFNLHYKAIFKIDLFEFNFLAIDIKYMNV